eukprot:6362204-Prorocentrum_lima.AAC.1
MDIGEKHADYNGYPRGTEWAVEWKSVYTFALLEEESTLLGPDCHEQLLLHKYKGVCEHVVNM